MNATTSSLQDRHSCNYVTILLTDIVVDSLINHKCIKYKYDLTL